jgi:LmbE family N-acetylglucosaminyl deacetylase
MAKVIIVAAHPDDETLGAGGAILKHKQNGDEVYWLIVTSVLEDHGFSSERVRSRQDEIQKVAEAFDFSDVFKLDYPTAQLTDTELNEIIPRISTIFLEVKPEIIYVMNRSDAHSDHRVIFDAVMACTKSFRYPFVQKVLMYECISETEFAPILPEKVFQPNYYIDITTHFKRKLEIMQIFESELGEHPFPRSLRNIEALAVFRGASAGIEYAEAFQLLKFIDK